MTNLLLGLHTALPRQLYRMIKKITGLGHCKDGKSILFRMVIAQKVYYRDKESEANKEIDPSGPVGHDILRVQIQTRDDPLLFSKKPVT